MSKFWLTFYCGLKALGFAEGSGRNAGKLGLLLGSGRSKPAKLLEKALLSWLVSKMGLLSATFLKLEALLNAELGFFLRVTSGF